MERRRSAASVLAVVAAGLVLVGGTGCAATRAPSVRGSGGSGSPAPPSTVLVSGRRIPFERLQPVPSASIASRSSRVVTIFVTGSPDRGGGPCGPPAIRILTEESPSAVRVRVADYATVAAAGVMCPAIGHIPGPQPVRLRAPLGDRSLVDGSTGRRIALIDGSAVPDLPTPPAPFTTSTVGQRQGEPVTRTWRYQRGGDELTMEILTGSPAVLDRISPAYGRIIRRFDVRGATATLSEQGGGVNPTYEVQWTPAADRAIRLDLIGSPHQHWTEQQAIALSRSVTGAGRTGGTGGLPRRS